MLTRTLIVLATLTALTGCSSLREPGSPKQSFDINADIQQLELASGFAVSIHDYYVNPSKLARNQFITYRLVTMNLHYVEFVKEVAVNKAQLDTALDVLNLGLTLASTVVGGPATAAILSAAAAGVAGTRISYDKNFFFEKTVNVLVTAMNAQRKTALIPIIEGLERNLEDYPFLRAVTDLHIYFESGTFNGALQAIQKDAGAKEVAADRKIDRLRVSVFAEDESSDRIIAWIWPDGRIDVNLNAIEPIRDRFDGIVAFLGREGLGAIPPQRFFDSEELADLRKKAIAELRIP